ncbi:MAG: beta-lactamase family protein [Clostridia bacterium]|nr:beta-lactamase family protein [Clostridia bacterium]
MTNLQKCLSQYIANDILENISIRVGIKGDVLYEKYWSKDTNINQNTLFDMASVTKIIATTTLALIALDRGMISLEDKVNKYMVGPADKDAMTIKHLLTHTMGIGYKLLTEDGVNYDNVASYILNIPSDIPIGQDVRYSCPGFILLGKLLEQVYGERLDVVFEEEVSKPLGMASTMFLPDKNHDFVNSNVEEEEKGLVNDYNCRHLGGVAGNAGVFSNITDMTIFAKFLLSYGQPLISEQMFKQAIRNYTPKMNESRGLGYLYVDEGYSQTGELFPKGSIGHCGHTGQSVFVDFESGLYVIILSDATIATVKKYGQEHYGEVMQLREDIHNAILKDLQRK